MDKLKDMFNVIRETIPPIHKEGHIFIFIFAAVTIFLGSFSDSLGWVGTILTLWCAYFFRDPERITPVNDGFVISPADGYIQKIEKVSPPEELGMGDKKVNRITIFLNVFNVHINRIPVAGEITTLNYHPGQFLSANLDKASDVNERQSVVIKTEDGKEVICVQIAGQIARRIICDLKEGQEVKTGERYGLIRFGSRADIYLPEGVNPLVIAGQTAIGGETVLADLKGKHAARKGEAR
ncbi:phosphatidylserine decarboxylase [Rickettsiales bacterium]|nr:phosphatidylserine decarboxylase [Rickettsiales bacterium]